MGALDPLPTEEEADRFFTEVLPPASPAATRVAVRAASRKPQAKVPRPRRRPPRPAARRRLAAASARVPWGWVWSLVVVGGAIAVLALQTPHGTVAASDLHAGTCTDRPVTGTTQRVVVVGCGADTARAQVDGRFWLPVGPYPGLGPATATALERCAAAGSPPAGPLRPVVPTAEDWSSGSRLVLCTHLVR